VSFIEKAGLRWSALYRHFLDLLFPPRCLGCRKPGVWLCQACLEQVPRIESSFCSICGDRAGNDGLCSRCRTRPLRIERIRSVLYFEGVLREAIHRLKYRGCVALAEPLGSLMAAYLDEHPMPADVVVPVPLHITRLRERGYNQAALLAHEMARGNGLVVNEHTLVRERATAAQVTLSAEERRLNVKEAFRCVDAGVVGRKVLLIDDVCTTGATLEACALALYEGGASSVQALTLARAR